MGPSWIIQWALNSMTSVLRREEKGRDTGRLWDDLSADLAPGIVSTP